MRDFELLQIVDQLLQVHHGEDVAGEDGMVISGALVIGLYASPEGGSAASWHAALGGMHPFAQEGVLRDRLRELTNPMVMFEDEDADESEA